MNRDQTVRFCWLREDAPGHLESDLGLPAAAADLPLAVLRLHPSQNGAGEAPAAVRAQLNDGLSSMVQFQSLPAGMRSALKTFFGPLCGEADLEEARAHLRMLDHVAARVADLAAGCGDVEVHLPYFDRKDWKDRFERLAALDLRVSDEGRLISPCFSDEELTYHQTALALAAGFTGKSDGDFMLRGYDPAGGDTVRIPGASAFLWRHAPIEGDGRYFPVYLRISSALQKRLRGSVPAVYFSAQKRWESVPAAHAMLVYRCSRVFCGRRRGEFAYDLLNPAMEQAACRLTRRPLAAELTRARSMLREMGKPSLAERYSSKYAGEILERVLSIQLERQLLRTLLYGDGCIINAVLELGSRAARLTSVRDLTIAAGGFSKKVHARLRRLYTGCDFSTLGSLMLVEATKAMEAALLRVDPEVLTRPAAPHPAPHPPESRSSRQPRQPEHAGHAEPILAGR